MFGSSQSIDAVDSIVLGEWLVLPQLDAVERKGVRRKLEPRVMRVLLFLLSKKGEVVARQALLDAVWPDLAVGEEALTQAISAIRKALGDDARYPRFVRTIPKRGYQLIDPAAEPRRRRGSYRWVAVLIAALMAASVGIAFVIPRQTAEPPRPEIFPSTSYPGRETDPVLSGDGRTLAFAWNGQQPDLWSIYIQRAGSASPSRLTTATVAESSPAFSPEADRIAFIRHGVTWEVVVRQLDTELEAVVGSCGTSASSRLAWSSQADVLVLSDVQKHTGEYELSVLDLTSGRRRPLTSVRGILGDRFPAISPDGSTVAFARTTAMGASDLWLVPLEGGPARQVTFEGKWIQGVTWIEKDRLLFSSNRSGEFELWSLAVKNPVIRWTKIGARGAVRPFASRQGSIVFEQQTFDSDLFLLGDSGTRPFARSTQWEDEPRWSPDGRRVAFLSARSGSPELWIADRDGKNPSQLTRFRNATLRSPRWSPDGSSIAFAVSQENSSSLWRVSPETAQVSRITAGGATDVSPAWSRDGQRIYFTSKRGDSWAIWSVSSSGGAPARVAGLAAGAIFEGRDGSLYFSRPDSGGIWRLTPERDAAVPVVERFSQDGHANWELVGDSLWYLDPEAKSLVMLDVGTGRERRGPILPMSDDDIGISVNLRGEVLYAAANRAESDLVVVRTFP